MLASDYIIFLSVKMVIGSDNSHKFLEWLDGENRQTTCLCKAISVPGALHLLGWGVIRLVSCSLNPVS